MKHKILVQGLLSATLDLLFHACLLALSPSGRHGRTTAAVIIMVLLLYCGWLLCCCYCCPCARRNWRNIYVEKTRTRVVQKKCGRKQRKAGTVPQVIDGGGVQLGTSEGPGRCQPCPLRKNIQVCLPFSFVPIPFIFFAFLFSLPPINGEPH